MLIFCRNFAIFLIISVLISGCSSTQIQSEDSEQIVIETDYLRLLGDLTKIMQAQYDDPVQNLDALRNYIESSKPAAAGMMNALNRDILALNPDQRSKWRKSAKPKIEEQLESFAKAQIQLRKRLNDAQNWELNEILALLHS